MGTTATAYIYDDFGGDPIVGVHTQSGGYPSEFGKRLAQYVASKQIVNGIPGGGDRSKLANGMNCLAALIVAHFKQKDDPGTIYLYAPDVDSSGDFFRYEVRKDSFRCINSTGHVLYDGPACEFEVRGPERI